MTDAVIETKPWYKLLFGSIDENILRLTNNDGEYYWDNVEEKLLRYIGNNIRSQCWRNHLALAILCVTDRRLTPQSIYNLTSIINARLVDLFAHFELSEMSEFNHGHMKNYIIGKALTKHTPRQRQSFLTAYNSYVFNLSKWIKTQFTPDTLVSIGGFIFEEMPFDNRDFEVRTTAIDIAKTNRKEETSAVTPMLPEIRAEAHFRYNQIKRLREAMREALEEAKRTSKTLPIEFSYDESDYSNEKWTFILWDSDSFVRQHKVVSYAEKEVFLEFVSAIKLDDGSPGDGIWFLELLKLTVLGQWDTPYITKEERIKIVDFLNHWGYEGADKGQAPFQHRNPGLLSQGIFITRSARKLNKLLINVEPIFIACMFARFALDIISSSGARMNELLQISLDKKCCVITRDDSIIPARKNYIYRLIPKGREEPENYYMPEDVYRFMNEILNELRESYKGESIPEIEYSVPSRKHLMSNKKFIFQYQNRHLNEFTINAIIRFLLHGIVIQTSEGNQVVVTTHLLRHAFATHAVQSEKIPIDIVKIMLHQKDITVTEYYSAPTKSQVSEAIGNLHDNWTSFIDIQKGILRGPEELKEFYENYKEKVGTMSKVVGGICTIDSVCPTKLACIGCAAKIPRPDFKGEIVAYLKWAEESEIMFNEKGLPLEAKKMKISKNRARNELKEIELIEKYQKDEQFEPKIRIQ